MVGGAKEDEGRLAQMMGGHLYQDRLRGGKDGGLHLELEFEELKGPWWGG